MYNSAFYESCYVAITDSYISVTNPTVLYIFTRVIRHALLFTLQTSSGTVKLSPTYSLYTSKSSV